MREKADWVESFRHREANKNLTKIIQILPKG